ncbi:MAG: hypothetical protein ABIK54_03740 [candidate division WOR-3 bacterium]
MLRFRRRLFPERRYLFPLRWLFWLLWGGLWFFFSGFYGNGLNKKRGVEDGGLTF